MHGWDGYGHFGWMALWSIFGLVVVGAILWAIVRPARRTDGFDSPETMLKQRYARGEIDEETYHRMLDQLRR